MLDITTIRCDANEVGDSDAIARRIVTLRDESCRPGLTPLEHSQIMGRIMELRATIALLLRKEAKDPVADECLCCPMDSGGRG